MTPSASLSLRKRGRPSKFGRPSQVIALTLPTEVIDGLRGIHPDVAWAIVKLFEKRSSAKPRSSQRRADVELASIAGHLFLIVVNRAVVTSLPGIQIIPLDADRAFLALDPERGMADLEIAVVDRLEDPKVPPREQQALKGLRRRLREWRLDPALRFHSRAIIVVEQAAGGRKPSRASARLARSA